MIKAETTKTRKIFCYKTEEKTLWGKMPSLAPARSNLKDNDVNLFLREWRVVDSLEIQRRSFHRTLEKYRH